MENSSLASIDAHRKFIFRVNPYNISWGYNLRTHTDDTYGGKVVQILGTDLASLTIDTVAGSGGLAYVQDFANFWKEMCLWQQRFQTTASFSFPAKSYYLKVFALSMSFNNKVGNVEYPISMSFQIQGDITGTVKRAAMTDTLKKLAIGIGYTRNDYNYPSPASIAARAKQLSDLQATASANAAENGGVPSNLTVNGTDSSLNATQQALAQTIIGTTLGAVPGPDGQKAAIIAIMAALTESTLRNLSTGDKNADGSPTSSVGLFQQQDPWGSFADRTDPAKATLMFLNGGAAAGTPGLLDIPNWQTLKPWNAAQQVQGSQFSDASNYTADYQHAVTIVGNIIGSSTAATTGVSANGVNITIPKNPEVPTPVQGYVIKCPTQGIANGITSGLFYLGTPYVYGGGTNGGGPDNGQSRAGGAENSGGSLVGFDCSGLTAFILKTAGFSIPDNSTGQRGAGTSIPFAQKVPGDIIGYSGHVAIYVATVGGVDYQLEAPDVGQNIHIRAVYNGHDDVVHRYWI